MFEENNNISISSILNINNENIFKLERLKKNGHLLDFDFNI